MPGSGWDFCSLSERDQGGLIVKIELLCFISVKVFPSFCRNNRMKSSMFRWEDRDMFNLLTVVFVFNPVLFVLNSLNLVKVPNPFLPVGISNYTRCFKWSNFVFYSFLLAFIFSSIYICYQTVKCISHTF